MKTKEELAQEHALHVGVPSSIDNVHKVVEAKRLAFIAGWDARDEEITALKKELEDKNAEIVSLKAKLSEIEGKLYENSINAMGIESRLDGQIAKLKERLLNYCDGNMEQMWAATVVAIVLDCDFRDSKQALAQYREGKKINEK